MTFPWEADHVYKSANDSRCNKRARSFYCVRIYFPLLNSAVISLVSVSFCSLRTPPPPPPPPPSITPLSLSLLYLISLSADIKDDCGNSCERKPAVRLSSQLAGELLAPEETWRCPCCYSYRRQRRGGAFGSFMYAHQRQEGRNFGDAAHYLTALVRLCRSGSRNERKFVSLTGQSAAQV